MDERERLERLRRLLKAIEALYNDGEYTLDIRVVPRSDGPKRDVGSKALSAHN